MLVSRRIYGGQNMKTMMCVGALAVGLFAAGGSAGAATLANGGFEAGPALNFGTYYRGPLTPTGWSRVAGLEAPDILDDAYNQTGAGFAQLLNPHGGTRFLDMNGASPTGGLYQDIAGLTAGDEVTFSYWVGRWAQNSAGTLVATLFGATTVSNTTTVDYLPGATSAVWTQYSVTGIVPLSGVVRLQFTGNSGSTARGAPGLDDVSMSVRTVGGVPEPATWALMIGGFGLAGGALRRRARLA